MANVLDLRRRIRSVKNTRQITKAMKMVSAAKLRRAQERAMAARPYARMLGNVLQSLVRRTDVYNDAGDVVNPLLVCREEKNILVLVVSGDKGFAGAFNSNIIKAAQALIDDRISKGQNVDVEPVGRKARDLYRRRYPDAVYETTSEQYDNDLATHNETIRKRTQPIEVTGDHPGILLKLIYDEVNALSNTIVERYERAEIDAVYLVFNEFKSVISQRIVVEKLLPIRQVGERDVTVAEEMTQEEREQAAHAAETSGIAIDEPAETVAAEEAKKFGTAEVEYIYDQPPAHIFRRLLPRYIATQVFHSMLESVAAEHAARMTAMDAATNNAGDMIDALSLTMNRVRQAAITKEIIEIVSGAAAL
ncbi:MAG TPA: FoF1 ATP synthase subunit gamma [Acidobacteriaceae bacterium]